MKNYLTRLKKAYKFAEEFMQDHTNREYHNFRHAKDVAHSALRLSDGENVGYQKRFELITAALLHDLIVEPYKKDNEERSAEIAKEFLYKTGYSSKEVKNITKLILATKVPTNPSSKMEKIICDADVDNLGRGDFFERGEEVRKELNLPQEGWYQTQIDFLKNHKYYTKTAKKLRNEGLQNNIKKLGKLL